MDENSIGSHYDRPAEQIDELEIDSDFLIESIKRLTKDQRKAFQSLGEQEARFLVDQYYTVQKNRIATASQIRSMEKAGEPVNVLQLTKANYEQLEKNAKVGLQVYAENNPVGRWLLAQDGIGPVIAAGFLCHFDIKKAPTYGHFWSFAGLNPEKTWEKGQVRPWNAKLKTLAAFKAGESFVKRSNSDKSFYGKIYKETKAQLQADNENFEFKEVALQKAEKVGKTTVAYSYYSVGKLPPAHIHARARRYAVKIFLSHLHYRWYEWHHKRPPADPYAIAHMNHAHVIEAPGPELI
jgi:hypothetical protein